MIRLALPVALALAAAGAQEPPPAWRGRLEKYAASAELWKRRRGEIRTRILVSAGLWPEFERPALKPRIFGKLEYDGFTVEKVILETWPGFYLTGNLYRPRGREGPFPAVVSPHGHWKDGRFTRTDQGDLPARGLTFARLGFVCFMYDMVGYGDFRQLPHQFQDPDWGMSLLGLQTWNSLRAVDFVASLPDVDPRRIGATGASGGGTQTFLLTAIDDRIACAAPVNMVAAEFQGGCSCENAPFLRIDLNNVEIAAATAPRPLLLVSCTGDWTRHNPDLEGPAIGRVYQKLGVPERFRVVQFAAPHNYNKDSREAVYAWFARWLQGAPERDRIPEPETPPIRREDLSAAGEVPPDAAGADRLRDLLRERVRAQLASLAPRDAAGLERFRGLFLPAFEQVLGASWPAEATPRANPSGRATVLVAARAAELRPLGDALRARGETVFEVALDAPLGDPAPPAGGNAEQQRRFPTCYFRTDLARQIARILDQGLLKAAAAGDARLVGLGEAGPVTLLARALVPPGAVRRTVIDLGGFDEEDEAAWSGPRAHPHLRRLGGLRSAAMLAAPDRLALHRAAGKFAEAPVRAAYAAAGQPQALDVSAEGWDEARILEALR
ncbi:MAG TPA: acetylxylan esterase [Planctomycetota bacterium]|nr:acetylxylan esterase [Planctomycetota bacterium]